MHWLLVKIKQRWSKWGGRCKEATQDNMDEWYNLNSLIVDVFTQGWQTRLSSLWMNFLNRYKLYCIVLLFMSATNKMGCHLLIGNLSEIKQVPGHFLYYMIAKCEDIRWNRPHGSIAAYVYGAIQVRLLLHILYNLLSATDGFSTWESQYSLQYGSVYLSCM